MSKIYQFNITMLLLAFVLFKSPMSWATTERVIHPTYTLDVYGSKRINANDIDKKYHAAFEKLSAAMSFDTKPTDAMFDDAVKDLHGMLADIKKGGDYSYMKISPIMYPGKKQMGITIDLVEINDAKRQFKFLSKPTGSYADPGKLIASWYKYENEAMRLIGLKMRMPGAQHCPAFHCLFGFEQPEFVKYAEIFNQGVPRYKAQLANILKNDKDEKKRGAAAYLLAHLKNGEEVISLLVPSVKDSSTLVRNNAMRVLGQTAVTVKSDKIPVNDIILATTYPAETDRNKALYVLLSLTVQPHYAEYVREHGCKEVMDQYNLTQPNLHENAYAVMTQISKQKFPASDYTAWNAWANKNCPQFQKA